MKLHSWQKDALKSWSANGGRGIVRAATGTGKTVLALAAAVALLQRHPTLRIRIVVPTIALANQWRQAIRRTPALQSPDPGFFGGGRRDETDQRVMIYVINSARSALSSHIQADFSLEHPVLLILDECHRYQSAENRKIFSFLYTGKRNTAGAEVPCANGSTPSGEAGIRGNDPRDRLYFSLGLSATPFSGDPEKDDVLTRNIGSLVYSFDVEDALEEGTIAPFRVAQVSASFLEEERMQYAKLSDQIGILYGRLLQDHPYLKELGKAAFLKEIHRLAGDLDEDNDEPAAAFLRLTFQRKEISILAEARNRCCMALLQAIPSAERVLIFSERIEQAQQLHRQLLRRFGSRCGLYHSQMTKQARERNLEDFRNGVTRILVSCRCLDEGIDVPDASVGIVLSSSAVPRQRIQRLGRIIRRSSGKEAATLYYIHIRQSLEDRSYLPGLEHVPIFDLRYYPAEDTFSNDLYEYAALQVLRQIEGKANLLTELRRCIDAGLIRGDDLLPEEIQRRKASSASSVHEKNYWRVMTMIARQYTNC